MSHFWSRNDKSVPANSSPLKIALPIFQNSSSNPSIFRGKLAVKLQGCIFTMFSTHSFECPDIWSPGRPISSAYSSARVTQLVVTMIRGGKKHTNNMAFLLHRNKIVEGQNAFRSKNKENLKESQDVLASWLHSMRPDVQLILFRKKQFHNKSTSSYLKIIRTFSMFFLLGTANKTHWHRQHSSGPAHWSKKARRPVTLPNGMIMWLPVAKPESFHGNLRDNVMMVTLY